METPKDFIARLGSYSLLHRLALGIPINWIVIFPLVSPRALSFLPPAPSSSSLLASSPFVASEASRERPREWAAKPRGLSRDLSRLPKWRASSHAIPQPSTARGGLYAGKCARYNMLNFLSRRLAVGVKRMLIHGKVFIQVVNLPIFRSFPLPWCIWSWQVCCQNGKITWNYWWRTLCSLSDDVRLCQRPNQEISQEIITFAVTYLLEHLLLVED